MHDIFKQNNVQPVYKRYLSFEFCFYISLQVIVDNWNHKRAHGDARYATVHPASLV